MKKMYSVILSLLFTIILFAQSGNETISKAENNEIQSHFDNRKVKGFYSTMHFNLLFGSMQTTDRVVYYYPYNPELSSAYFSPYVYSGTHTRLTVSPSFTISNGYIFNEHWSAGIGIGMEIFDYNLFPLYTELRYTLWDDKISPFWAVKGGYSIGNFKSRHYDEINLSWAPYSLSDAELRNYGGFMFHPEMGVKLPVSENCDILFTAAYRYQKTKSIARKEYDEVQFDEWEHNEKNNRLSFGLAIIFR